MSKAIELSDFLMAHAKKPTVFFTNNEAPFIQAADELRRPAGIEPELEACKKALATAIAALVPGIKLTHASAEFEQSNLEAANKNMDRILEQVAFNLSSLHDFPPEYVAANEKFALAVIEEYQAAAEAQP